MSSRRSERSRTTQPPSGPAHSGSSSSTSSTRADRVTRSNQKQSSPHKSSTPHSLSSEDCDDGRGTARAPPATRLRSRDQDNGDLEHPKLEEDVDDAGSDDLEEEITRCVCTHQEWPGPAIVTGDPENDEGGGFFIQCDKCKVWQHGGCVGLVEDQVPESYYCEECRPGMHKIFSNPQGQKYSWYEDVPESVHSWRTKAAKERERHRSHRKSSLSKEPEPKPTGKESKEKAMRNAAEALKKRRSTMNSRAAVEEDEILRKVLEESKTDAGVVVSDGSTRKGKRSRDESEEAPQETKRPRTDDRSPSSSPAAQDETEGSNKMNGAKAKPRGAAARNQRDKEMREEKERERAEAAGRRKGRAERRRGEDPPTLETENTNGDEAAQQVDTVEVETPDTPSASTASAPPVKKSGRPPSKRTGRGRGQHTRDNATPNTAASPTLRNPDDSPLSPSGRANGETSGNASDGATGKQGKVRNWRLEKISWNDIRKPAGAMLNYIQQRQLEMAENKGVAALMITQSAAGLTPDGKNAEDSPIPVDGEEDLEKFKNLTSVEMMDYLSRDIEHWNQMVKEV